MFIGEYDAKLDEKGRVVLPFQLLRQLDDKQDEKVFVIKKDIYEKNLLLFPIAEWKNQNDILKKRLNPFNKKHSKFLTEYNRGSSEIILDKSNRLLIPKKLIDFLGDNKNLIFEAKGDIIAIWAKDQYEKEEMSEESFAELAGDILGGDFIFSE